MADQSRTKAAVAGAAVALLATGGVRAATYDPKPAYHPLQYATTPGATNPAVTQNNVGVTVCVANWTDTVRPPTSYTTSLKRQQLAAAGWRDQQLGDYEEDHAIPLALGGDPRSPLNLWPEAWGRARATDVEEARLHRELCAGHVTLEAAQKAIVVYKHRHG